MTDRRHAYLLQVIHRLTYQIRLMNQFLSDHTKQSYPHVTSSLPMLRDVLDSIMYELSQDEWDSLVAQYPLEEAHFYKSIQETHTTQKTKSFNHG